MSSINRRNGVLHDNDVLRFVCLSVCSFACRFGRNGRGAVASTGVLDVSPPVKNFPSATYASRRNGHLAAAERPTPCTGVPCFFPRKKIFPVKFMRVMGLRATRGVHKCATL